eukprot:CAMPEP_0184657522 /NCGR_PEP_ID=MMETSP0308-20130426/20267_1 /TAXON_ID=38269 /ORGANISM="Gloeochaete witrockiana, Strain SAG 46.84" /LENGTH=426 /DNA_ID=CAMNT_0027095465 /DNA_START=25 /DNA_END=1305 /DNA_ORIENTATION=+
MTGTDLFRRLRICRAFLGFIVVCYIISIILPAADEVSEEEEIVTGPFLRLSQDPSTEFQGPREISDKPSRCPGGRKWCEDVDEAVDFIYKHQHPESCSNANILLYDELSVGIGGTLALKSAALACALTFNRVLVMDTDYHFEGWTMCPKKTMDCLFQPLSGCPQSLEHHSDGTSWEQTHEGLSRVRKWVEVGPNRTEMDKHKLLTFGLHVSDPPLRTESDKFGFRCSHKVPPQFAYQGRLWWRAVSFRYFLRLNDETKAFVDKQRAELAFPSPRIAVHVRRTDKVTGYPDRSEKEMDVIPMEKYMQHVRMLSDKHNIKNVLMVTDEPSVIEEAKALEPSLNFFHRKTNCSRPEMRFGLATGYEDSPKFKCCRITLADIIIASESDYFVGVLYSNFSFLLNLLQKTNGKGGTTFIDVQGVPDDFVVT